MDLYTIPILDQQNQWTTLENYRHQVLLITNVASRCGFTPQYAALEKLYQTLKPMGFSVLAFPCNQFGQQEPGTNTEIKQFATECYRITFPIFGKLNVKSPSQSPIYNYLQKNLQKKPLLFVPWNFTKILVNQQGDILKQFYPWTSMRKIKKFVNNTHGLFHNV